MAELLGHLDAGRPIIAPTETLYGFLARLDRPEALQRVVDLKGRDGAKPMPCVAAHTAMALACFDSIPHDLDRLAQRFWPGPLTLIGPAKASCVGPATGGGPTIGVRVPGMKFLRTLTAQVGVPLAATSANRSGRPGAGDPDAIAAQFADEDVILYDAGILPPSKGSTVVDLTVRPFHVVREGDVPIKAIEAALRR